MNFEILSICRKATAPSYGLREPPSSFAARHKRTPSRNSSANARSKTCVGLNIPPRLTPSTRRLLDEIALVDFHTVKDVAREPLEPVLRQRLGDGVVRGPFPVGGTGLQALLRHEALGTALLREDHAFRALGEAQTARGERHAHDVSFQ
jgi:hypothetical protein